MHYLYLAVMGCSERVNGWWMKIPESKATFSFNDSSEMIWSMARWPIPTVSMEPIFRFCLGEFARVVRCRDTPKRSDAMNGKDR